MSDIAWGESEEGSSATISRASRENRDTQSLEGIVPTGPIHDSGPQSSEPNAVGTAETFQNTIEDQTDRLYAVNETMWGVRSEISQNEMLNTGVSQTFVHHSSRRHRGSAIAGDLCKRKSLRKNTGTRPTDRSDLHQPGDDCDRRWASGEMSSSDAGESGSSASLGSVVNKKRRGEIRRLAKTVSIANREFAGVEGQSHSNTSSDYPSSENSDAIAQYLKQTEDHRAFLRKTRGWPHDSNALQESDAAAFQNLTNEVEFGSEASSDANSEEISRRRLQGHAKREKEGAKGEPRVPKKRTQSRVFRYLYPHTAFFCRTPGNIIFTMLGVILLSFLVVPILSLSLTFRGVLSNRDYFLGRFVKEPTQAAIHGANLNQLLTLMVLFGVYGGVNISTSIPVDTAGSSFLSPLARLTPRGANSVFISTKSRILNISTENFGESTHSVPVSSEFSWGGSEGSIYRLIESLLSDPASGGRDRLRTETVLFSWARYLLNPQKMALLDVSQNSLVEVSEKQSERHTSVSRLLSRSLGKYSVSSWEDWNRIFSHVFGKRVAGSKGLSFDIPKNSSKPQYYSVKELESQVVRWSTLLLSNVGRDPAQGSSRVEKDVTTLASRGGILLRRLGNLARSRAFAIKQRHALFADLLATPTVTGISYGAATSVIQSATTVLSQVLSNSSIPSSGGVQRPLGANTASRASTLELSFARIYYDVIPVVKVTRKGSSVQLSPLIYTDDVLVDDGKVATTHTLPDLQLTSRSFPVNGSVSAQTSYSSTTNTSLKVVNDFYYQLASEGPLGTASMGLLLSFQREIVRGIVGVCVDSSRLGVTNATLNRAACSSSQLFQEIRKLSSAVFRRVSGRLGMLLSKISDGTFNVDTSIATHDGLSLFCDSVGYCNASRNVVESKAGRSACNSELWRRHGRAYFGSTTKPENVESLLALYSQEIAHESMSLRQEIRRLLRALVLLRYDMKVQAYGDRTRQAEAANYSLEEYLAPGTVTDVPFSRPSVSQTPSHVAFVSSVTFLWLAKAIGFTKGMAVLASRIGEVEAQTLTALAYGNVESKGIETSRISTKTAVDLLFGDPKSNGKRGTSIDFESEDLGLLAGLLSRNQDFPRSIVTEPLDGGNSISDSLEMLFDSSSRSSWFFDEDSDFQGLGALLILARAFAERSLEERLTDISSVRDEDSTQITSEETAIAVCSVLFSFAIPILTLWWGLLGFRLRTRRSNLSYRWFFAHNVVALLLIPSALGALIAYFGIFTLRTNGLASFDDVLSESSMKLKSLEGLMSRPQISTESFEGFIKQTNVSRGLLPVDFIVNNVLYHYLSPSSSSDPHHSEGISLLLRSFVRGTLAPVLGSVALLTNETANAVLLVGGEVTSEEVRALISSRLESSPFSQNDMRSSNLLSSLRRNAPLVRSDSLRHSLRAATAAELGLAQGKDIAMPSKRSLLRDHLAPFRSFQTLVCISESEQGYTSRDAGCDARSQQLLAAAVAVTGVLGTFIGEKSGSVDPTSTDTVLSRDIHSVVSSDSRRKLISMASEELLALFEDCSSSSASLNECNATIEQQLGTCQGFICQDSLARRYTGFPNNVGEALADGLLSDLLSKSKPTPKLAFENSFTNVDVPAKGVVCSPISKQKQFGFTKQWLPSHPLDGVQVDNLLSEMDGNAALAQYLIQTKIVAFIDALTDTLNTNLQHTTRLIVWISIVGCVTVQALILSVYRLGAFESPTPVELM